VGKYLKKKKKKKKTAVGKAALEVQKIDVEVGRKTIWQSCASGYPGPLIITYDYLATYTASHHFIYSTNIPFSPTVRERERERERERLCVGRGMGGIAK
jgi:hypothetical protein